MIRKNGSYGFTLIELMVVVAVISILAGILIPSLARAKMKGRQVQCLGQLRQMGLACFMYWEDNEDHLFPYKTTSHDRGDQYWFGRLERGTEGNRAYDVESGFLFSYLRSGSVSLCPSFSRNSKNVKWKAKGATYGYGYNFLMGKSASDRMATSQEIRGPTSTGLFTDCAQVNTFQYPASPSNPMLEEFYYFNSWEKTTHFRHQMKSNTVFADGHGEATGAEKNSMQSILRGEWLGHLEVSVVQPF